MADRSAGFCRLLLGLLLATLPTSLVAEQGQPAAASSTEQRVQHLLGQMTTSEKLNLVHGYFPGKALKLPGVPTDMIPSAGLVPGIPRLGIPELRESDASLGVANQRDQRHGDVATALPSGLALAASFDPDLAYRAGAMIGTEARAKTFNVLLAGGVNLTRDPWNGRNFEYLGEDPLLAGLMGSGAVRGVQSNHIISTVKHFALNAQETGRHVLNAIIDPAALRESDLLAFQIAIEQGHPGSVMCGYNRVNGAYSCENKPLLDDVLKRDWRYPGWVMSDWGAVHSAARAANSGLDQESGEQLDSQVYFDAPLRRALQAHGVSVARLDDMVARILRSMIATGVVDHPIPKTPQPIDYEAHGELSREVADKGIVLLKNKGNLLPLSRGARRIVLIGSHADVGVLSGGGSSQVRSVGGVPVERMTDPRSPAAFARLTYHASSPLDAIRRTAPGAAVSYLDGKDVQAAARAARQADVVIVFAHQWMSEARDAETLALPGTQDVLIAATAAANPNTIIVLETGGPVLMPWLDRVGAVLESWYPGQRGGQAIADVLFGLANPSGRLPITFPASAAQAPRPAPIGLAALHRRMAENKSADDLPPFDVVYREGANVGYRWYALTRQKPLFPFGFGQSYTQFKLSDLRILQTAPLRIAFDVTNIGDRAGADVPQVYIFPPAERHDWAERLIGWQRVELAPGERRHVELTADPRLLANFSARGKGWIIAPGRYRVGLAENAGDVRLTQNVTLSARRFP